MRQDRDLAAVESAASRSGTVLGLTEMISDNGELWVSALNGDELSEAGESLQLIVAGREIMSTPPYFRERVPVNRGTHMLHFGGDFDAYLLVPGIPS